MSSISRHDQSDPVTKHMHRDYAAFRDDLTVSQALEYIRTHGMGSQIMYFYVTDWEGRLSGVLPARRLLTSALDSRIADIMEKRIVTIPDTCTVLDACEYFVMHRLLAFPVVDSERRILGVVDVTLYTEEILDLTEKTHVDRLFESLGFRLSSIKNASFLLRFRIRFSWLTATIVGGTACALLSGLFHRTLEESIILSFFLTLVLGLGESVCVQSLALTAESLRQNRSTLAWYFACFRKEMPVAFLLGASAAIITGGVSFIWKRDATVSMAIASGITTAVCVAALAGLTVPAVMHRLKIDLRVASGPIALAIADIFTILCYFTAAAVII
jgi:magnesium transporter